MTQSTYINILNMNKMFIQSQKSKLFYTKLELINYPKKHKYFFGLKLTVDKSSLRKIKLKRFLKNVFTFRAKNVLRRFELYPSETPFEHKYKNGILYIDVRFPKAPLPNTVFRKNTFTKFRGFMARTPEYAVLETLGILINQDFCADFAKTQAAAYLKHDVIKKVDLLELYVDAVENEPSRIYLQFDAVFKKDPDLDKKLHELFDIAARDLLNQYKVPLNYNPFSYEKNVSMDLKILIKGDSTIPASTVRDVLNIFSILLNLDFTERFEMVSRLFCDGKNGAPIRY